MGGKEKEWGGKPHEGHPSQKGLCQNRSPFRLVRFPPPPPLKFH